jgi:hypothetical protein
MASIGLEACVRRKADVLTAEINGEVVTMNAELGEYYSLNPIASDIWHRLVQPKKVEELVAELTNSYEGEPSVIQADVILLIESLSAKGLLITEG